MHSAPPASSNAVKKYCRKNMSSVLNVHVLVIITPEQYSVAGIPIAFFNHSRYCTSSDVQMRKERLNANVALFYREDLIICAFWYHKPSGMNPLCSARDICMQIHAYMNMYICIDTHV